MSQVNPCVVFIDRCLGNKRIVSALQEIGITVEIHDDHFPKDTQDTNCLPEVGRRGWIVLTKDSGISKRNLEKIAVARATIKMFVLASKSPSGANMVKLSKKLLFQYKSLPETIQPHSLPKSIATDMLKPRKTIKSYWQRLANRQNCSLLSTLPDKL